MATDLVCAKNGSRVFAKILQRLARGAAETTIVNQKSTLNYSHLKRNIWYAVTDPPAVDMADYAALPVALGDLAWCVDSDAVYICSVAVAAATNATFIQLHA